MNIIYAKAEYADLDEISALIKEAIALMHHQGIEQWDEIYPTREDFRRDIDNDSLYKGCIDGKIAVVFTLNPECETDYLTADWEKPEVPHTVLHRFCVHPAFQHQGVGSAVLRHIEELCASMRIGALRLDAFCQNPFSLAMYGRAGYKTAGYADWRKGHFVLLEKYL